METPTSIVNSGRSLEPDSNGPSVGGGLNSNAELSPEPSATPLSERHDGVASASDFESGTGHAEAPLSVIEASVTSRTAGRPMPDDPDKYAKEAFLAGSDEAFLQLYSKYEVSLLYYCKRMLHNEWAAEDAFQEIWTRVFELRKRPGIAIDHFRGLLFRSARNLCLNILRTERYDQSLEEAEYATLTTGLATHEELAISEPMTSAASGREIQALMIKALTRLPFDQRETFVLHEYSGFSYGEIAEMMSVPERNVKVRAYRARMRLRKFIQGWLGLGETDDPVSYI